METAVVRSLPVTAEIFPLSRKLIEWKRFGAILSDDLHFFFPLSRKLIEWKQVRGVSVRRSCKRLSS